MGLLIPIEPKPPLTTLDELVALMKTERPTLKLGVQTKRLDVAQAVLASGREGLALIYGTVSRQATTALAEHIRRRTSSYVDASHPGGTLRVWPDRVWIDSLTSDPAWSDVRARARMTKGDTVYDVKGVDLERSIATWMGATPEHGNLVVSISGEVAGTETVIEAMKPTEINLYVECAVDDATKPIRCFPKLEFTWSAGSVSVHFPERRAEISALHPVSVDKRTSIAARYDSCRKP